MKSMKLTIILILLMSASAISSDTVDSLVALLPVKSGEDKIVLLNELSKAHWGISVDKAFEYANQALELSLQIDFKEGEATAFKNLGVCHSNLSEHEKALEYYHKALRIYEEIDDKIGIANALNNIGVIYIEKDEYDKALEYYVQSAKIYEEAYDTSGIAASLLNMGLIYDYLKSKDKALEYYEESYNLFEQIGEISGSAMCLNNIGNIFSDRGDNKKALEYYQRCLKINEEIGDLYGIGDALLNIGYAYDELEDYYKSLEYYEKSIKIDREAGDKYGVAINLNNIGDLYRKLKKYGQSNKYLSQSLEISTQISSKDMMKENYDCLAKLYDDQGNHEEALKYYKLFSEMKDSIFTEKNSNQIAEMQTKYDTEKKVRENELLRKEKEIQQATISRQRTITISIGIGLCLVLGMALVVIRAYKNKKKANLILNRQKLQIEEQANELKQANDKLIELGQFKEAMTGMIVHDLKNPLGAIINYSEDKNDLTQNIIHQAGKQMLNMVLNILDVQKFEDARMKLETEHQNLSQIARTAIDQVEFLCREKNIDVINKCSPDLTVVVDSGIIERVFINLMTNAVKYSPLNEKVILETSIHSDDYIKVSIIDNGGGIPKDKLDRVFDKFQQVEPRKSSKIRSTGLGLSFCKMAVMSHGGEIGVESDAGQGAKFWFTLKKSDKIAASIHETDKLKIEELTLTDLDREYLKPFIEQFSELEIYEISNLRDVLKQIQADDRDGLQQWKEELRRAVYTSNDEKYRQLINI